MPILIAMKTRNSHLRTRIEQLQPKATELVQRKIDECAMRLMSTASSDTPDGLTDIFENLRARALILVEACVAKREDFPEID